MADFHSVAAEVTSVSFTVLESELILMLQMTSWEVQEAQEADHPGSRNQSTMTSTTTCSE